MYQEHRTINELITSVLNEVDSIMVKLLKTTIPDKKTLDYILSLSLKYSDKNKILQVITEKAYYSINQIKLASALALKAHRESYNISKSTAIEFLLYLAGTTQIKTAIEKVGVSPEEQACIILASSNQEYIKELEQALKNNIVVKKTECHGELGYILDMYGIPKHTQDKTLNDNHLEVTILTRIALTVVEK